MWALPSRWLGRAWGQRLWGSAADERIKEAAQYLRAHAEWIVTQASVKYFQANGWANQSPAQKERLVVSLVSLLVTQPHGYHLLPDEEIRSLCCDVGAMENTLQWRDKPSATKTSDVVLGRALAAGAHCCVPSQRGSCYPVIGEHRFVIPLAIAAAVLLVAVARKFDGGLFGSARQLPSSTYENVATTVVWCTLEALRMHVADKIKADKDKAVLDTAALDASALDKGKAVLDKATLAADGVPAMLAFPSLAHHFPQRMDGGEEVTLPMDRLAPDSRVHLYIPGSTTGAAERVKEVTTAVKKYGLVLEMAGVGCPRNDLTIHGRGRVPIGFEFKSHRNPKCVDQKAFEKRCFHMGFNVMEFACGVETQRVDVSSHENEVNLLGRYTTLGTDTSHGAGTEFMVLCGPCGDKLLPVDTTVWFRERVVFCGDDNVLTPCPHRTCHVVTMAFEVEELIHRCAAIRVAITTGEEEPVLGRGEVCDVPGGTSIRIADGTPWISHWWGKMPKGGKEPEGGKVLEGGIKQRRGRRNQNVKKGQRGEKQQKPKE